MKLFKQIAKIPLLNKPPDVGIDLDVLKKQVGDGFFNILLSNYKERENDKLNSSKGKNDASNIIDTYTNSNMLIAGSAAIVPGPLGIFTAIPELVLSVGNQMKMIYDLGCAYDKEDFLNQDLLLEIPIFALGGNSDLSALQFADDMPNSPEQILRKKAFDLGEGMLKKSLKQSLVTWVPIGGSVVMTVWSKMSSKKIANSSITFYDDSKLFVDNKAQKTDPKIEMEMSLQKIKLMINLIESDNEISDDEIKFIQPIIKNSCIPIEKKEVLIREAQQAGSNLEIAYDFLKNCTEDEKDNLFYDLVVMAKRDGETKPVEKGFLIKLAEYINYDQELINTLIVD